MKIRRDALRSLEALIMGIFFVQSVRYLYAALFADISSADLVRRVPDREAIAGLPGVVDPATVQGELVLVGAIFLAPLLAYGLAFTRWSLPLTVAVAVVARYLTLELPDTSVISEAVVVGATLLYVTLLIMRRAGYVPTMLVTGLVGDQLIRAANNTYDPTFDPAYSFTIFGIQAEIEGFLFGVAILALILTTITTLIEREEERMPHTEKPKRGVLTLWSGLALGGLLFLEFTVLGLPNVVARWAGLDYTLMLPLLLLATSLPLVPEVRAQAGNFLSTFDGAYRGWLWALLLAVCIIVGKRFDGLPAGVLLVAGQFLAILTLWWLVRPPDPESPPRINPTPVFLVLGLLVFFVLTVGDYFTYDYAFVRPFVAPFGLVSDILSGMQGMGIVLALVAVVLLCLPMILERQAIPWRQGRVLETLLVLALVLGFTVSATRAAVPETVRRPLTPDCLRVLSLNINGGYTQFFAPNLELVADTIALSGADVALLQEVDTGRLTSGGVDQALWLANRLNMHASFFPLNEDLQGLLVLSRLDPNQTEGALLTSENAAQAGVQYITYRLDDGGDLHVYNVWLSFQVADVPLEQQAQFVQQEEIYRLVAANHFAPDADQSDRVVLGGSFKYGEESVLYDRWAETVLIDPFTGLFEERRNTVFTVDNERARWDYIWLSNLVPSGISIDQRNAVSDYRPSLVAVGRQTGQGCPVTE
ncbi:MAG: endonuclease/exonuclease/phosphatase family protein [Anaerolineales bacterium]